MLSDYVDCNTFPCNRNELISSAEDGCAPDTIINALEELPDIRFLDLESVIKQAHIIGIV